MFPQTIPMTGSSFFEKAFHLLAQDKQSVWLSASGSQRSFRAEARTHFISRERKCCSTVGNKKRNPTVLPLDCLV